MSLEKELDINLYIKEKLSNTTMSIGNDCFNPAIEMVDFKALDTFCWESSSYLSTLFDDTSFVKRGNIILPNYRYGPYFHSWIEIEYCGCVYVFDPSLGIIKRKDEYYSDFNPSIQVELSSKKIKNTMIKLFDNGPKDNPFFEGSVFVRGTDNINDPFFRANSSVLLERDKDKVKKLKTKFYYNA